MLFTELIVELIEEFRQRCSSDLQMNTEITISVAIVLHILLCRLLWYLVVITTAKQHRLKCIHVMVYYNVVDGSKFSLCTMY